MFSFNDSYVSPLTFRCCFPLSFVWIVTLQRIPGKRLVYNLPWQVYNCLSGVTMSTWFDTVSAEIVRILSDFDPILYRFCCLCLCPGFCTNLLSMFRLTASAVAVAIACFRWCFNVLVFNSAVNIDYRKCWNQYDLAAAGVPWSAKIFPPLGDWLSHLRITQFFVANIYFQLSSGFSFANSPVFRSCQKLVIIL